MEVKFARDPPFYALYTDFMRRAGAYDACSPSHGRNASSPSVLSPASWRDARLELDNEVESGL